jgi:phosphoribosylanthranilate isomerase
MKLKISSITSLTDARFFSAIGADYLGFCFDVLNDRNISVSKAKEIIGWLHNPFIVGEFGIHQTKQEIEFIASQMQLNEIQIPYEHPQKAELSFEKFLTAENLPLVDIQNPTDYFVIKVNETELANPALKRFISANNVFIETNFSKANIQQITETLQPYGIQLSCKNEEKPGWSSVDEYAELLEIIGFS